MLDQLPCSRYIHGTIQPQVNCTSIVRTRDEFKLDPNNEGMDVIIERHTNKIEVNLNAAANTDSKAEKFLENAHKRLIVVIIVDNETVKWKVILQEPKKGTQSENLKTKTLRPIPLLITSLTLKSH